MHAMGWVCMYLWDRFRLLRRYFGQPNMVVVSADDGGDGSDDNGTDHQGLFMAPLHVQEALFSPEKKGFSRIFQQ
jgi:hypothetical protein